MTGEKKFSQIAMYLVLACLVFGAVQYDGQSKSISTAQELITWLEFFYSNHPLLTILLFCLSHLVSSTLGIPGGCTVLNICAGSIFGFWLGCSVVYPITMVSAFTSYSFARSLSSWPIFNRYSDHLGKIQQRLRKQDLLFFVTLRLSPFLPFNVVNVFMGLAAVPPKLFFTSTFVGIFFDVTLLNSVGAALKTHSSSQSPIVSVALFMVLFGGLLLAQTIAEKANLKKT